MGKLDQILLAPLARISVDGGDVLHALKHTDVGFIDFAEAYFSLVKPGAVKAWKRHLFMTLNLIVPVGSVSFVFFDEVDGFLNVEIGSNHYCRLTVPPGVWFGFKGVSSETSMVLSIADIVHDPSEVQRKKINDIYYEWGSI